MSETSFRDKVLFTPGPLTTSLSVKAAMLRDLGSRDHEFVELVRDTRRRLLALAGTSQDAGFEAIPLQGSGTFAVEAVISSCVPRGRELLVIANGAYGRRMVAIAERHGIRTVAVEADDVAIPTSDSIEAALAAHPGIAMVAAVHSETTTGLVNPIEAWGAIARRHRRLFFVDAMSSFGALPIDLEAAGIDFIVSSANKCIEGVPGFAFAIVRRDALIASEGSARTVSLDLLDQWRGLEANGQFRFTPPTHALLAFHRALLELEQEGGVVARGRRYARNHELLVSGMRELGFEVVLDPAIQGPIITSFFYPDDPRFDFARFYDLLNERGFAIYPGKLSRFDCFRIGTIGRIGDAEVRALVAAIGEAVGELGVTTVAGRGGVPA
ncbi:MAG: 2-aminoethylphosphonate--pyruvate transaminase [Myxococcales bacterium]|nr:2-aminoethylphosphonate--pyruvate transaminase [Myxococcales bacterium]